jgi:hypothetical protein
MKKERRTRCANCGKKILRPAAVEDLTNRKYYCSLKCSLGADTFHMES